VKIQCYMPVFNEADVLPHTLRHLAQQGCDVHIIDGWSTDGSWEIAVSMWQSGHITCERFPVEAPDPIQNCTAILKRIEDLAYESDADWILYSDADEWRRSPSRWPTLLDAVDVVHESGYNAIDFRVFQFYCVDDSWKFVSRHSIGPTPEDHFLHYDEADCISRIPNRKLWKNEGRVTLAGGGHEVQFPGMCVYPQKFTMKHYPFRTPEQARRKIETRIARRRQEEFAKGWGTHYTAYVERDNYVWDPEELLYWRDTRSPLP
jgi:glycosyltransferase involved in cell wall biosynthesis